MRRSGAAAGTSARDARGWARFTVVTCVGRAIRVSLTSIAVSLTLGCGEPAPVSNLVLITVDTLRADHLGSYGSELGATPHLDALASESVRFETVRAPAPFTLASIAGLMTGRHPVAAHAPDRSPPERAKGAARHGLHRGA